MEAPVARVCGLDTPFPLVFEPFYMPTKNKVRRLVDPLLDRADKRASLVQVTSHVLFADSGCDQIHGELLMDNNKEAVF